MVPGPGEISDDEGDVRAETFETIRRQLALPEENTSNNISKSHTSINSKTLFLEGGGANTSDRSAILTTLDAGRTTPSKQISSKDSIEHQVASIEDSAIVSNPVDSRILATAAEIADKSTTSIDKKSVAIKISSAVEGLPVDNRASTSSGKNLGTIIPGAKKNSRRDLTTQSTANTYYPPNEILTQQTASPNMYYDCFFVNEDFVSFEPVNKRGSAKDPFSCASWSYIGPSKCLCEPLPKDYKDSPQVI